MQMMVVPMQPVPMIFLQLSRAIISLRLATAKVMGGRQAQTDKRGVTLSLSKCERSIIIT